MSVHWFKFDRTESAVFVALTLEAILIIASCANSAQFSESVVASAARAWAVSIFTKGWACVASVTRTRRSGYWKIRVARCAQTWVIVRTSLAHFISRAFLATSKTFRVAISSAKGPSYGDRLRLVLLRTKLTAILQITGRTVKAAI